MTASPRTLAPAALTIAALLSVPLAARKFDTKSASFSLRFQGETSGYRDLSAFVLPGTSMDVEIVEGPPGEYTLTTAEDAASPLRPRKWRWRAPATPGVYTLKFDGPGGHGSKDTITMHAFVMTPAGDVRDGWLKGYRIGDYPKAPLKNNAIYRPPVGFVEVTKDNEDTRLSPHFRLKQFVCKQEPTDRFPKYVVLKERLPLKLEAVLELVNELGFDADTLHVMSAYRTPFYNHAIGDVLYSMHQWGGAADVFIDTEKKDRMDDLNQDGRVDIGDSRFLYNAVERMLARPAFQRFEGGMGFYPPTAAHPPFVHVDVRGTRARWQG